MKEANGYHVHLPLSQKRHAEEKKQRRSLNLFYSLVVFGIIWLSILLAAGIVALLIYFGVYPHEEVAALENGANMRSSAYALMWLTVLVSLLIGAAAAFLTTKFSIDPIGHLVNHINRLAQGEYGTRLEATDIFSKNVVFQPVIDSVNKLAEELENTEMLRSDFVGNFSHEFKTPIVSIAGFAKLLKKGNLTEEQKAEYLDIIEEESLRLSTMATNVLNMTRIENQFILKDTTTVNVSEQLRSAILLLDEKWDKKHLELDVAFGSAQGEMDEHYVCGSEEILKQVWINLLDNAIKFTPEFGSVQIKTEESEGRLILRISNTGPSIPPEKLARIWNKFYQCDGSHATAGNGLGLAIVKKVVELHGGQASVTSENDLTTFTIDLPAATPQNP